MSLTVATHSANGRPAPVLDPRTIAAIDAEGMLGHVLELPAQLADARRRMARSDLPDRDLRGGLLVCGMGGSAIGADLAVAVIGSRARRPIRVVRDYAPDPWIGSETLVLCASYSGNTEETLEAFALAGEAGAPRAVLTTGGELARAAEAEGVPVLGLPAGLQPRAAVAYMLAGALEAATRCGVAPDLAAEIDPACRLLAGLAQQWRPGGHGSEPERLARRLSATTVVYGAGPTVAVAVRWKAQLNENAKLAAFSGALPDRPQRDLRLARRRARARYRSHIPRASRPASPRRAAHRAHRFDRRRVGRERRAGAGSRSERARADALAGDARGPGVRLPGRPRRRGPDAGGGDRGLQAAALRRRSRRRGAGQRCRQRCLT